MAPSDAPRAVLRVPRLLALLGRHPRGLALAPMARALGVPKTTTHTILRALEAGGYVRMDEGCWRLGPEAVLLGAALARSGRDAFPDCARGVLHAVARASGETGFLAVLDDGGRACRYVAAVESDQPLRFSVTVGSTRPAYATGSGRAMLAFMDDAERAAALEGVRFERLTRQTVASRAALERALEEVRRTGLSIVDGGTVDGVTAIAAPILHADGRVAGAVTVGGPTTRLAARTEAIGRIVAQGAWEASRLLGYEGGWPPG